MNSVSNKNFFIFLGMLILASIVRFGFNSNMYILNIVAGINIIAFWYVCYLILESVQNTFYDKINGIEYIGEHVIAKKKKHFKNHIRFYEIFVLVIGVLYIVFLANAIVNDIISLCALFLSVENDYISKCIKNHFVKKR